MRLAHILMIYYLEKERVHRLIRYLAFPLNLASKQLIADGSFSKVIYHMMAMEKACIETMEVAVKGHVISIVPLVFYLGVRIFPVEIDFIFSLSIICK